MAHGTDGADHRLGSALSPVFYGFPQLGRRDAGGEHRRVLHWLLPDDDSLFFEQSFGRNVKKCTVFLNGALFIKLIRRRGNGGCGIEEKGEGQNENEIGHRQGGDEDEEGPAAYG